MTEDVWARLREAAAASREHAAATVSALAEERAEIERERRAHPAYEQAREERERLRATGQERPTAPP